MGGLHLVQRSHLGSWDSLLLRNDFFPPEGQLVVDEKEGRVWANLSVLQGTVSELAIEQ